MAAVRVRKFKFTTTIIVKHNWVEDGFDVSQEKIIKKLKELLPYAIDNEILIKLGNIEKVNISIPSFKEKRRAGYQ